MATDPNDPPEVLARIIATISTGLHRLVVAAHRAGYLEVRSAEGPGYPRGSPAQPAIVISGIRAGGEREVLAECWLEIDGNGVVNFNARTVARVRRAIAQPVVDLGPHVFVTDGARAAREYAYLYECLDRHRHGDWGHIERDEHDRAANDRAVVSGARILSAYPIDPGKPCRGYGDNTIWIITEGTGETRQTVVLLPDEY